MRKRLMCRTAVLLGLLAPSGAAASTTWYVDRSVASSGDGTSWATAFKRIQEGIDAAAHADTVIVAQGTYGENVNFNGKNIVLCSTNPLDPSVVEGTIIKPPKEGGSVVAFAGTENETCVLSGFTIRDGNARDGGGIIGGTTDSHTHAAIQNNTTVSNTANLGGGLAYCNGVIESNTISENNGYKGAGLYRCNGSINGNTISGNTASYLGGGLDDCGPWISDNLIIGNSAGNGAGLAECDATIVDNMIAYNDAFTGGGLFGCGGTICNNAITGNAAIEIGGGLVSCNGTIRSNTIAGNASHLGGALMDCTGAILNNTIVGNWSRHHGSPAMENCVGTIHNCIIWGNIASQLANCTEPTHSCIEGWTDGGTNIGADPSFISPGHWDDNDTPADPEDAVWMDGDYHLQLDSLCIDAGDNSVLNPPGLDLDGNLRIAFGKTALTVDMGAYEFNSKPFAITEFVLVSDTALSLTWNSQPNDTYVLWFCTDPTFQTWVRGMSIPSDGATTTFTVVNIAPFPSYELFRVEMTSP